MRRINIAVVGPPTLIALSLGAVFAWINAAPATASGLVTDIGVGAFHACAIKNGGVWCWGEIVHGKFVEVGAVGDEGGIHNEYVGSKESRVPVAIPELARGVTAISAGLAHTCAVKDGGAWCWGNSSNGELGGNSATEGYVPVPVAGLETGVTAISAGVGYTCAVKDGGAWCWGDNSNGELGNNSAEGSLVPVPVAGLATGVTAISASAGSPGADIRQASSRTCALKDGGAWCWGDNGGGALGNNSTERSLVPVPVSGLTTGVTAISAGDYYTCAVKDGGAWCWGHNHELRLGNTLDFNSRCETGIIRCDAMEVHVPVPVSGMASGVSGINASVYRTCAVREGGAWCWGCGMTTCFAMEEDTFEEFNAHYEDNQGRSHVPVAVLPLSSGVTAISAGVDYTCAVREAGAWCWGQTHGFAIFNNSTNSFLPVAVLFEASSWRDYTDYIVGAVVVLATAIGGAGWYVRRKRA
jgi:alpha-tubulin suppressor-like RCC1 family protein